MSTYGRGVERRQTDDASILLASIVESSDDAIISKDLNGIITSWNRGAERLFGYTAQEMIGQSVLTLIPSDRLDEEPRILEHIRRGEKIDHYETVRRRKDGTLVDISLTVSPLTDAHGQIVGASKIARDISERRMKEEQQRRWNDELEARVAERTEELTLSQLRLRALAGELNITEQRQRQRLAADLHDYLGQLLALSQIKLSLAKKESQTTPLATLITDVQDVLRKASTYTRTLTSQLYPPVLIDSGLPRALQLLSEQMGEGGLSVSLKEKTKIPALPEDQAILIFQSVRELLHNCLKHAQTQEATIILEQVGSSLHVTISDQGRGFDASTATSIKTTTSGFGLFSIRERMFSMGGRFDIQSMAGKGTQSTLILPMTQAAMDSVSREAV